MNMRTHKRQRDALTAGALQVRRLGRFAAGLSGFAASALRTATTLKRLQSAVTVFGMEIQEHAELKYPQHFRRPTRAGEMADAAVARAQKL
jgi:hypothetical protein